MTLIDDINTQIGHFTVDSGDDESAAYPVLGLTETYERIATDGATGEAMQKITWRIKSVAVADTDLDIVALMNTIKDTLAKRGKRIKLVERFSTRVLPAEVTGSVRGYPRITVDTTDAMQGGPVQSFDVIAETMLPIVNDTVGGVDVIEHIQQTEVGEDINGVRSTRVSGSVRVENGEDALTWLEANIIDAARTAAEGDNETFTWRWRGGYDTSAGTYEYTSAEPATSDLGGGITSAEVRDITTTEREGRTRRVISGYAEGVNASTFAADQEPTPGSLELLVSKEVSQPSTPTGRVDFRYEMLLGTTDATIDPNIVIWSFTQSITRQSGGRSVQAGVYNDTAPKLWQGSVLPFIYNQDTTIEFSGPFDPSAMAHPTGFTADDLLSFGTRTLESRADGVRRMRLSRSYIFTSEQTIPAPKEVASPL